MAARPALKDRADRVAASKLLDETHKTIGRPASDLARDPDRAQKMKKRKARANDQAKEPFAKS